MSAPVVTALYAGLLGLVLVVLAIRVIALRRSLRIAAGDGGNPALASRVRAHANFGEYVPMAVLLLAVAELTGSGALWIHLLGAILVVARIAHAYSMSSGSMPARVAGVMGTFVALIAASLLCLMAFLRSMPS